MKKKKKKQKVKIHWEFHPDRKKFGKRCKYVYLYDGFGKVSSGRWHLKGFDTSNKKRFVAFFDKKTAKQWAKEHDFKVVNKKKWRRKFNKLRRKFK